MSIGIIAEYNPFHNGHIYQLNQAKILFPNQKIVVIMSGKYVQRGEIAVASFNDRKRMALAYGAHEVVELPFEFATQAAHVFAEGAVKLAASLGVTTLFFGSESNNENGILEKIAKLACDRYKDINREIKPLLKQGNSFPKSFALALDKVSGHHFSMPNDILGLEYCKVIYQNGFNIKVATIKRTIGFHAQETNGKFASASFIRQMIFEGKNVSEYTPMNFQLPIERIEDHYSEFQKKVINSSVDDLRNIQLMSEGMENLFKKLIHLPTYDDFVSAANSRRYTSSRIKRVMLYVLLDIKKK